MLGPEPYTLVVIDVQPNFPAAQMVLDPLRDEMRAAIHYGAPILLVEYRGEGLTLVKDEARRYKTVWTVTKRYDSGAPEIEDALHTHKLPQKLRVTGVNTSACVTRTIHGLRLPKIEVVEDCCWCVSASFHRKGIAELRQLPNVKIVKRMKVAV